MRASSKQCAPRMMLVAFTVVTLFTASAEAGFVPIPQPDATYLAQTTLLPISGNDFDTVISLSSGSFTVSFDSPLVVLTTPTTWSNWGSPPDVESSTPRVLWTNGVTALTITLSNPVGLFGFEAQPNTQVVSSLLASFFLGGNPIGEIPLDVDGTGGARLFAASSTDFFDTVVLSSTDDFAIAQVRFGSVPEPGFLVHLIGLGVVGIPALWVRSRRLRLGRAKAATGHCSVKARMPGG
jgi:hypothetical protein